MVVEVDDQFADPASVTYVRGCNWRRPAITGVLSSSHSRIMLRSAQCRPSPAGSPATPYCSRATTCRCSKRSYEVQDLFGVREAVHRLGPYPACAVPGEAHAHPLLGDALGSGRQGIAKRVGILELVPTRHRTRGRDGQSQEPGALPVLAPVLRGCPSPRPSRFAACGSRTPHPRRHCSSRAEGKWKRVCSAFLAQNNCRGPRRRAQTEG